MRVFVTGASGWIGSAVVPELIGAGHQVVGLARSDASAAALAAAGAEVQRGTLDDLDTLRECGCRVGWRDPPRVQARPRVLGRLPGRGRRGSPRRRDVRRGARGLRSTVRDRLGTLGLAPGRVATERDGHDPDAAVAAFGGGPQTRLANAELTLALASRGVRSSVVRLPPTNHGDGDNGFMATLVGIAREQGRLGLHRRRDQPLARRAPPRLRAPVPPRAGEGPGGIDAARGRRRRRADPRHRRGDRAASRRPGGRRLAGGRGRALHLAGGLPRARRPASSTLTRELLGWQPTHPGLIADLDQGHYFQRRVSRQLDRAAKPSHRPASWSLG